MISLRERLSLPGSLPHTGPASVPEIVETHASWVFLTEGEVFKLKKPVNLGFLDYSTLAKRKVACEAELVLNRRLSPDVYLSVEPVRWEGDGARVGGDASEGDPTIVDWAVRMKRLADDTRADVRLAHGRLDLAEVDRLAKHLVAFHEESPTSEHIATFGAPETIAVNVEENFEQTRADIERFLSPAEVAEIVAWQRGMLRERAPRFERRALEGRVRDGHGDLRLEHVYFGDDGHIRILDCIEFNERFRLADVAADLAFLSMDLGWHARVDLAERLLSTYAEESGDFGIYEVIDFYVSYRAFVRGKIAAMSAVNAELPDETRKRAEHDARRYFVMALAADRRSMLEPSVTAVGGLIAAGKTTVAEAIARETSAPIVSADRTRKQMLGVPVLAHLDPGTFRGAYDPAFTERVYSEMLARAEQVLASGRPVILDASFRSVSMRRDARSLAENLRVPFRFVECKTSLAVVRARLRDRERGDVVSDARVSMLDEFASRFEPVTELATREHVVVDTSRPVEESLKMVRKMVATWPPLFY